MHFGCKVNEIRHSNKGTGVEKLQCLTMHNKTLINRNIKTKKETKAVVAGVEKFIGGKVEKRKLCCISHGKHRFLLLTAMVSSYPARAEETPLEDL